MIGKSKDNTDLDKLQKEVIEICEKKYGTIDHNRYFMSENDTVYNVRHYILDNMSIDERYKNAYLDMILYILQIGDNVFISLN